MSTNTITSFSGLWKPTEYRNIEAGKVSISPNQATCHPPDYYGRATGTQKALAEDFYYLDPYSGGGSGTMHAGQVATLEETLNHYNTASKARLNRHDSQQA
ncbi:MAG TPA: hypothetical protein VFM05_06715 [Candidatus Saccharimonadales bacterium]|nr:hypothetical protein [Candidatus Saccharimonadales bacterium]